MDYTKIPRHLIYKDRKDIDDFPVTSRFDYQCMEEVFLEVLEQRPFIKESYDAPDMILKIFNNARYITTLICLENHPNHYLHRYLEKAGSNNRSIVIANHAMPATMALVINYLCHYMPTLYEGSKIVEEITNNFNTKAWKENTHGGYDDFDKLVISNRCIHDGWLNDSNFAPRDIREIANDPFVTACNISENIDYILDALQKSVSIFDEEIAPLNDMYKKLEAWFPSDIGDDMNKEIALNKIAARLKVLDPNNAYEFYNLMNEMEKSLQKGQDVPAATKDEIKKYLKNTLGVDIDELESAYQSMQADSENEQENHIKLKTGEEVSFDQPVEENASDNGVDGKDDEKEKQILKLRGENDHLNSEVIRLTHENEELRKKVADGGESEWISCFDGFLHSSLNPRAIAKALNGISHSHFPKRERGFWWVFVTVLTEIKWIPTKNYKMALQWANLHFNCGWDWNKDNQFKFSDINEKIRSVQPSSKWNKNVTGNVIGDYYGELAKTMKETFVVIVEGNKLLDKNEFILPGRPLINNGRK